MAGTQTAQSRAAWNSQVKYRVTFVPHVTSRQGEATFPNPTGARSKGMKELGAVKGRDRTIASRLLQVEQ